MSVLREQMNAFLGRLEGILRRHGRPDAVDVFTAADVADDLNDRELSAYFKQLVSLPAEKWVLPYFPNSVPPSWSFRDTRHSPEELRQFEASVVPDHVFSRLRGEFEEVAVTKSYASMESAIRDLGRVLSYAYEDQRLTDDFEMHRDKIVGMKELYLGNGTEDGYRGVRVGKSSLGYRRSATVLVRITDFDPSADVTRYDDTGETLVFYEAEALPGQLTGNDYVSWMYGPTYKDSGVSEVPWILTPACVWLNALDRIRRHEFLAGLRRIGRRGVEALLADFDAPAKLTREFRVKRTVDLS